jgi:hypothetical protein
MTLPMPRLSAINHLHLHDHIRTKAVEPFNAVR